MSELFMAVLCAIAVLGFWIELRHLRRRLAAYQAEARRHANSETEWCHVCETLVATEDE